MRSTRVKLLPEPGPAIIRSGPSVVSMAFNWLELALLENVPELIINTTFGVLTIESGNEELNFQ